MNTIEETMPRKPENPFVPLTTEQILVDLDKSHRQIEAEQGIPTDVAMEGIKRRNKNRAYKAFMEKMEEAENSVREQRVYTEEEVEAELDKI